VAKQPMEMKVAELQPGMEVASAVVDAGGQVLLPAGAVLAEATIAGLARRDIGAVAVLVESAEDPAAVAARREHITRQLEHAFRRAGEGAATRALFDVILAHRLEGQP